VEANCDQSRTAIERIRVDLHHIAIEVNIVEGRAPFPGFGRDFVIAHSQTRQVIAIGRQPSLGYQTTCHSNVGNFGALGKHNHSLEIVGHVDDDVSDTARLVEHI
jgi:hypothetical protein